MEVGSEISKVKSRKKKFYDNFNDDSVPQEKKNTKRVILSLSKPSYTLGLGLKKVRTENRERLWNLLRKLVRQHNWTEAAGVLSMLLKGTCKDSSLMHNREKYWVTMELLKRMEIDQIKLPKMKHMYETWMRRIGSIKDSPSEERFLVQSDYILFCLMEGDAVEAHHVAKSLTEQVGFESDPIANLVVGLTYYQLWYSTIPEEMQLRDLEECYSPRESDKSTSKFSHPAENPEWSDAFSFHEPDSPAVSCSYTSIANNKDNLGADVGDSPKEEPVKTKHAHGFYMISAEDSGHPDSSNYAKNTQHASIFSGKEWESHLLPLRWPRPTDNFEDFVLLQKKILNDDYKDAVKYLQLALCFTPPVLAALSPLVQLFLIADQVKEAVDVLEKFCDESNMPLFFRLRADILEQLGQRHSVKLATSCEDVLKRDPTCSQSLARLITMHRNGDYAPESLLEMIATHLEATYAEYDIWREFALCLHKLSLYDEDRMSTCVNGNESGSNQSIRFSKIPRSLVEGQSGRAWRVRCKWWLTRHFSKGLLASEISAGQLELLTYKAACACYLYGREFMYAVRAHDHLQKESGRDLLLFFREYTHDAVGFYDPSKRSYNL